MRQIGGDTVKRRDNIVKGEIIHERRRLQEERQGLQRPGISLGEARKE